MVGFDYSRQSVCVNHYYFYLQDEDFGPASLKVCSYAPFGIKVCLNGHEWAKQQLRKAGIPFEALDNGFLSCPEPDRLQALCDQLGVEQIQGILWRVPKSHRYLVTPYGYKVALLFTKLNARVFRTTFPAH